MTYSTYSLYIDYTKVLNHLSLVEAFHYYCITTDLLTKPTNTSVYIIDEITGELIHENATN